MQSHNASIPSAHLNLPADSREVIAGRPKVPQGLYTPIEDWQTRILTILPGTRHVELRCELNVVDLVHSEGVIVHGTKRRLHYQALSYSWGYLPSTVILFCNGQQCQISSSLALALRTIRHKTEAAHLWVDAFCINQADLSEKSQQIRGIRLIFAKAEKVAIWLGDSEKALQLEHLLKPRTSESHDGSTVIALGKLLATCRVFRRSWVRQEVAAARRIVFVPESKGLTFEAFCSMVEVIVRNRLQGLVRTRGEHHVDDMLHQKDCVNPYAPLLHMIKSRVPSNGSSFFNQRFVYQLLRSCLAFQATDPRDKVYGVLGLLPEHESAQGPVNVKTQKHVLHVDYTKSVAEVYMDMTVHILLAMRHFGALELHTPSTPNTHCLPSWVLDFDSPSCPLLQVETYDGEFQERPFKLINPFRLSYHAPHGLRNIAPHSPILRVQGIIVGNIKDVSHAEGCEQWLNARLDRYWYAHVHGDRLQVNPQVKISDTLVFLDGADLPFVLRPIATAQTEPAPYERSGQATENQRYYRFLGASLTPRMDNFQHKELLRKHFTSTRRGVQEFHLV